MNKQTLTDDGEKEIKITKKTRSIFHANIKSNILYYQLVNALIQENNKQYIKQVKMLQNQNERLKMPILRNGERRIEEKNPELKMR